MPVTPRRLRRRLQDPVAIRVGAGILAGAIGMSTAAYGVLQVVQPFKGNGVRSEPRPAAEEAPTPTEQLTDLLLALVPSEAPSENPVEQPMFLVDGTGQLVTSVVDTVNGSTNGVVTPGSGGGSGNTGGSGGGGGGLLGNLGGGSGGNGGSGGGWTPPGGGGGSQGLDVPSINNLKPPVTIPDLTIEGEEEDPCAQDEAEAQAPALIDPRLHPNEAEETEDPACTEEGASAPAEEEAPVKEPPTRK